MVTVTKTEVPTTEQLCAETLRFRTLFLSKELRDETAKNLKGLGFASKRGTVRGQQIHPEYIADYVGTYETGFGNTDYQRVFPVLYTLSVK